MGYRGRSYHSWLLGSAAAIAISSAASAADNAQFDIAPQPLASALNEFSLQSHQSVLFTTDLAAAKSSQGVSGQVQVADALSSLLAGTGLSWKKQGDTFLIVSASDPQSGSAAGAGADAGTVQALIVTAQKREENIQDVPIAMSAFSQEDLTRSQVATGADLMTQVPNMTFTKTNFTGYSIQIRGIGTQAISVTTDPAVAVAFNNTPFIRNRFFEQEFYDLQRVEVLRGPQGTLYGRNATAGVVNLISAKPSFHYEAKLSADVANYNSTRLEGMLNLPLVDDKVAVRFAGAWTKRDGFTVNESQNQPTDGRNLWSTRLSLRIEPTDSVRANLVWEHFQEDDDRLRSAKQLCHRDATTEIAGHPIFFNGSYYYQPFNQNCLPASLYSPDSFEAPNGMSLPYRFPTFGTVDVYQSTVQSRDLRAIQTEITPEYKAKSDIAEIQLSLDVADHLTLTSETGYNADRISSFEDYNRFAPNHATFDPNGPAHRPSVLHIGPDGTPEFCDPQLGCADHLMAADLSKADSRQFSEELRLASDYEGSFNFSLGANFLRYDTMEKYYVFINTLTLRAANDYSGQPVPDWPYGAADDYECLVRGFEAPNFNRVNDYGNCQYIDPNPIGSLNDMGHNYFLSQNPYKLISYAVFGETYYNIADNLKLTAGLRWTVDKKNSPRIPSWVLADQSAGYPVVSVERQEWREPTGRLALDWKPKLSFTDETLLYASYAHGYKAGGSNPPPTGLVVFCAGCNSDFAPGLLDNWATHPLTFRPEFVNAYEIGSKNTLLDGKLTLNGNVFFYDYTGYQISQIVDRSAINFNFDAKIWGAELELDWRPLENLRFGLKGGYEKTRVNDGQQAVDVMERNYGHGPDSADPWVVVKPFPTFPSNCVVPLSAVVGVGGGITANPVQFVNGLPGTCEYAYALGYDPATNLPYVPNPTVGSYTSSLSSYYPASYPGYDPNHDVGQNHGAGFFKPLGGHELPNAPHFTTSVTADYTIPLPQDWLVTLHTDLYYQSEAWARIFNTPGYDKLKAFTNVNLAVIFSNEDAGWKVMAYVKNVFDKDNITGAFLNSDDTGLTTNVFLVEPRLYGLRVTKEWTSQAWWTGANPSHVGPYPLTIELGGSVQRQDAPYATLSPTFASDFAAAIDPRATQHRKLDWGDGREVKVTYRPGSDWSVSAGLRYGRANSETTRLHQSSVLLYCPAAYSQCHPDGAPPILKYAQDWSDSSARTKVEHTIADFSVGKDVGLGMGFRNSTASLGLRYADFSSDTSTWMHGIPDWYVPREWSIFKYANHSLVDANLNADRRFKGAGPTLSWAASHALVGSDAAGHLDIDWSLTVGALFGKQKTSITGTEKADAVSGKYHDLQTYPPLPDWTTTPVNIQRSKSVTVPVVDLSLGLSYDIQRVKVSTGYRWERYSNVLDGGYAERKSFDRTNSGPYFKVAIGFGG